MRIYWFVIAVVVILVTWASLRVPFSAEQALQRFHANTDVAEDQIIDPLILAGKKVVPKLVEAVKDKTLPNRRYAIRGLGEIAGSEIVPFLKEILDDSDEKTEIRCDALTAVALIDLGEGKKVATRYKEAADPCLSKAATEILSAKNNMTKRSYLKAFFGVHE